jgi:hypothetical protein
MSTSESFRALRRGNPRSEASFTDAVDAVAAEVRSRIPTAGATNAPSVRHVRPRRRLVGVSAAGIALAAAAAVFLTVGSPRVAPGVESASAAIKKAVKLTTTSAKQSGTVDVRITHHGQLWANKVIRWNGDDLELNDLSPQGPSSGYPLLVVNGMMYSYSPEPEGWSEVGPISSIDPGSGTTPSEQLSAIREDVGGKTLPRVVAAMTASGLTRVERSDGSKVYSGDVPAGIIAPEVGFKEGQSIRVLPFGYVAHGAAANAQAPLHTEVTVVDHVFRQIEVTWGTWRYIVRYSGLGTTPAPVAPANAKPLRR